MFFGKYLSVRSVGFLNIGSISYKKKEKIKDIRKPFQPVLNNGFLSNYFLSQQEFSDVHEDIKEVVAKDEHFGKSLKKIGFVPVLAFIKQSLIVVQRELVIFKKSEHRDLILINKKGVFPLKFYLSGFLVGKFARYCRFRPRNLSAKRRISRINLRQLLVRKLSKVARSLKSQTVVEKKGVLVDAKKKTGNFFFFEGVFNLMTNNAVDLGIVKQGSVLGHSTLCDAGALQKAFLTNNNYLSLLDDYNTFFSEHYAVTVNNSTRKQKYTPYKLLKTRLQNSVYTKLQSIIQPFAFLKKHMSQTNMRYLYMFTAGRFRLATLQRLSLGLLRKTFITLPFQSITFSYRRTLYKYVKTNKRRILKLITLAKRRRYYTIVKCYNRFFFGNWSVLTKKRRRYRYKARRRVYRALRKAKFKNKLLFFFYRLVKNIKYIVRQHNLYPLMLTGVSVAKLTRIVMFSALKTFKHYTFFLALKRQLLFTSVLNRRQSVSKLKGVPVKFRLFFSNKVKSLVHFVQNSRHYLTGNKKRLLHLTRIFVKQAQFGKQYKFTGNTLKKNNVFFQKLRLYKRNQLFFSRLSSAQRRRVIKQQLIYAASKMRHFLHFIVSIKRLDQGFKKFVEANYKKAKLIGQNVNNKRNDYFLKFFSWSLAVQKNYYFNVVKKKIKYYSALTKRLANSLTLSWITLKKTNVFTNRNLTVPLLIGRLKQRNKAKSLNFRRITLLKSDNSIGQREIPVTNQNAYKRVTSQILKRLFNLNVIYSLTKVNFTFSKKVNIGQLLLRKRLQMYIKKLTIGLKSYKKQVKKYVVKPKKEKIKSLIKRKLLLKVKRKKRILKVKNRARVNKKTLLLQTYMFLKNVLNLCVNKIYLLRNKLNILSGLEGTIARVSKMVNYLPKKVVETKKFLLVIAKLKTLIKNQKMILPSFTTFKKASLTKFEKKKYLERKQSFGSLRRVRFFELAAKNFTARYKLFQLFKQGLRFKAFGLLKNIFVFPQTTKVKKFKKLFKKLRNSRVFLSLPNRWLEQQYGPLFVLLKLASLAVLKNMVVLYYTFIFSNPRLLLFFSLKESLSVKTVGLTNYIEKTLSYQTIHSVFYSFLLDYLYTANKYGKIAKKIFIGHRFGTFKKMKPKYW